MEGCSTYRFIFVQIKLKSNSNQTQIKLKSKSPATILSLKTYQKRLLCYHLPCSLNIPINTFALMHAKTNSKELCEEYSFLLLRKMLMSAFLLRFRTNYLEKNAWPPQFSFVDSNSPCKDLLFPHRPNLTPKPSHLVGTFLPHETHR